MIKLLKKSI